MIVVVIIGILAAVAIPKFAATKGKAHFAGMTSDLHNLVTAEEAFFSDSSAYTTNLASMNNYKTSTGVNAPTITVGSGFWSATVSHTQITGKTCAIAVNPANPNSATAGDGEPVCK